MYTLACHSYFLFLFLLFLAPALDFFLGGTLRLDWGDLGRTIVEIDVLILDVSLILNGDGRIIVLLPVTVVLAGTIGLNVLRGGLVRPTGISGVLGNPILENIAMTSLLSRPGILL